MGEPGPTEVVRAYLELAPHEPAAHLLWGDLVERERILLASPQANEVTGYRATISKLELTRREGDEATCDCDVDIFVESRDAETGEHRVRRPRLGGPFELVHRDGWKIRSYSNEGLPVHDTFKVLHSPARQLGDGVSVRPVMIQLLPPGHLNVFFEIDNGGSSSVTARRVRLLTPGLIRPRRHEGLLGVRTMFEPGASGILEAAWGIRLPQTTEEMELELDVRRGEDGSALRFTLPFAGAS